LARGRFDSWSWFPNIAAQGILAAITGAKAWSIDLMASVAAPPSILSPAQEYT
jgi:hypothetical protein